MKDKFVILIDKNSLNQIIDRGKEFRDSRFIFKKRAELVLELSDEEYEHIFYDNAKQKSHAITPDSTIPAYFLEYELSFPSNSLERFRIIRNVLESHETKAAESELASYYNDIIILDIKKESAIQFRKNYGIWLISMEEFDDEILCMPEHTLNREIVAQGAKIGSCSNNGWKGIFEMTNLSAEEWPPFNSIIVFDKNLNTYNPRYKDLYRTFKERVINCRYIVLENLLDLFEVLLPENHLLPIHILVVGTKNTNKDYELFFERRIKEWIQQITSIRDYSIEISVLLLGAESKLRKEEEELKSYNGIHPRFFYTNYYRIIAEKGFQFFSPMSNSVHKEDSDNEVTIETYFRKSANNPIEGMSSAYLTKFAEELSQDSSYDLNNNLIIKMSSLHNAILNWVYHE